MFCPRCLNEKFEHVPNVIHAEERFGFSSDTSLPDEIPGPNLKCTNCELVFVNHGTHLEVEPDYLPAA